jgi:hypothetical protein
VNLWFYGIYAHIFITKAQRIKWILVSAAAMILLTSVGPWSIPNVTKYILTAQVEKCLDGQKLPASSRWRSYFGGIRDTEALDGYENKEKIISGVNYLGKTYGAESIKQFFSDVIEEEEPDIEEESDIEELPAEQERPDPVKIFRYGNDYRLTNNVHQVKGFNNFVHIDYSYGGFNNKINCQTQNDNLVIDIINRDNVKQMRNVPIRETVARLAEGRKEDENAELVLQGHDCALLISKISAEYNTETDSIFIRYFNGYLFYNKENKK